VKRSTHGPVRGLLSGTAAAVLVGLGAWVVGLPASTRAGPPPVEGSRRLPEPVAPAFALPESARPVHTRDVFLWAPVERAAAARRAPRSDAGVVGRVGLDTPEGTTNIVQVIGRASDSLGSLWVRVRLSSLPNGRTGWLPRSSVGGYTAVRTRLVVDRERLQATLWRGRRVLFRAPVGVGRASSPTPAGRFYIRNKLTGYGNPAYGPLSFGTSARSATLTEWPAGGHIGIHGTDRPDLLPGRVSHGCIRMSNDDIVKLGRLMPVGTPLLVR
jgi:lipoprotein-anchoring transpeptidase ErfK/SrfK